MPPDQPNTRLVLDTNVVASAMLWGGAPLALLQAARSKRVQLYVSLPLLEELTDILARAKFARKVAASGLTVDQLVDGYAALTSMVRPAPVAPTIHDDPDDDLVLATAKSAQARFIVSGDRHLLRLANFEDIEIVRVSAAVVWLSSSSELGV